MSDPAPPPSAAPADLPFEEALARLEALVRDLETGEVPLAELITRYEQGSALLAVCERRLREAEIRLEQLKTGRSGPFLVPFESRRE